MPRTSHVTSPLAWWQERGMQRNLQDLLLVRAQRRYRLRLADADPLGATDPSSKIVYVNPVGIAYPLLGDLRRIRYAPHSRQAFHMAMCRALIEHEAGHIVNSGRKPKAALLGWLWNALEDERQERIQATNHPDLADAFTMLGDAMWLRQSPTQRLIDGCLVYRWEWDRPSRERRFCPVGPDADLWMLTVLPLVEAAWAAPTSDEVARIAREILHVLGLEVEQPLLPDLPVMGCGCGAGEIHLPHQPITLPNMPNLPPAMFPVSGPKKLRPHQANPFNDSHDVLHPEEADPSLLQARVAGYQRSIAAALKPIQPVVLPRPHASRGELDLDRALDGHAFPFDALLAPGPAKSIAIGMLIDLSSSMTDNGIMPSVREVAMVVNGAAEIAHIPCAIFGFDDQADPILIRPLSRSRDVTAHRRIAGMVGKAGTLMSPAFRRIVQVMAGAPAHMKLLIILVDGDLTESDAAEMHQALVTLPRGLLLLPCYVGVDERIADQIRHLFGKVLDATDLTSLRPKLCNWLRDIAR